MSTMTTTVGLHDVGPVGISLDDAGEGEAFLLLHGGGGPDTMTRFGQRLAESHPARVLVPTHPGFAATTRPEKLDTIPRLAELYVELLDDLDLSDVTVIGNSIGGWITEEMALMGSPRISGIVLLDAVGIEVADQPVADFFTMDYDDFLERAFHNPDPFRMDPTAMPPAAQAAAASNRSALATYTGGAMNDPTLAERLGGLEIATLVLWGDSDRIPVSSTDGPTPTRYRRRASRFSLTSDIFRRLRSPTQSSTPSGSVGIQPQPGRTVTSHPPHNPISSRFKAVDALLDAAPRRR
jgi:pimeloyl-ACP methyl ester carboxylesterase